MPVAHTIEIIKICGITRLEDAQAALREGANAVGFVFWPKSPRCIDVERARAIVAELPRDVLSVGVFVDQPADSVNELATRVGLSAVQLHGQENHDYVRLMSRPVIKAVAIDGDRLPDVSAWQPDVMILLDVHDPVRKGGTGKTIDWVAAASIAVRRKILLAGGLTPENVSEAIARVRPYGIDVSSGVEQSPGIKDHARIKALFEAVHGRYYATRS